MNEQALSDLKVLEYADFISGPFCAKLMADLGAEVIKIEEPSFGDTARQTGPFPNDIPHPERSGLFLYLNTNKRSITLNPQTLTGANMFRELVKTADILVENISPSTMEKLGLDYESLRQLNPRLIMTSVTPFGQFGPYSHYKANDLICYQMSGLGYHTRAWGVEPRLKPVKPGGRQSDFIAGSTAAVATMFAVAARQALGVGQHLDVSQQESIACFLRNGVSAYTYDPEGMYRNWFGSRARTRRRGFGYLPCKDGYVINGSREEYQWRALMELVVGDEWEQDKRFKGALNGEFDVNTFLVEWGETIGSVILEWTMKRTKEEVTTAAQSRGVPIVPWGGSFGFGYLRCKDGYVVNGCREEYQWRPLLELVVGDEWEKDERFKGAPNGEYDFATFTREWGATIGSVILEWTTKHTREEVTTAAQSKGVPIVPCNSTEDLFKSSQFAERGFFVEIDHSETGKLSYPGAPYKLSETPWRVDQPAPLLGQHNEEILCGKLGYSKQDLVRLRESGVI